MVHTMVNTAHFPSMMSNYGKEYMYINLGQIEKDKFQSIIQKHEKKVKCKMDVFTMLSWLFEHGKSWLAMTIMVKFTS